MKMWELKEGKVYKTEDTRPYKLEDGKLIFAGRTDKTEVVFMDTYETFMEKEFEEIKESEVVVWKIKRTKN